jgi:hypothetical protein
VWHELASQRRLQEAPGPVVLEAVMYILQRRRLLRPPDTALYGPGTRAYTTHMQFLTRMQDADRTPPPKGLHAPMGLSPLPRRQQHGALAAATARTPHIHALVSWASPRLNRVTDTPQCRRPHHVTSGTRSSRAPPTDVWPLRVPQVCAACTLAAATARAQHARHLSAATEWLCGVARHNPPTALPSVGLTWPKPGAPGPKEEGRLPKSPSRSIVRGRNGRGRAFRPKGLPCRCRGSACLPLPRFAAHGMWSPSSGCGPLTLLAASSHAKGPAQGSLGRCHRRLKAPCVPGPDRWPRQRRGPCRPCEFNPPALPRAYLPLPKLPPSLPTGDAGRLIPYVHAC